MTALILWASLNVASPAYQTFDHARALARTLAQTGRSPRGWSCEVV